MTEPRMTGTKVCSKCKRDLPVICFSVDKRTSDGLCSYCRECRSTIDASKHLPNRKKLPGRNTTEIKTQLDKGWIS